MSTMEVAYQLEGRAKYIVASPSLVVPFREWPYEQMFAATVASHGSERVAVDLFQTLSTFYELARNRANSPGAQQWVDEVPLAILDLESLTPHVEPALKRLVESFKGRHGDEVRDAALRASRGDSALVDVVLLCELLLDSKHETLSAVGRTLRDAI